jgi:hypothetical protein
MILCSLKSEKKNNFLEDLDVDEWLGRCGKNSTGSIQIERQALENTAINLRAVP